MSAPRWFIARNKEKVGPFSGAEIKQLASFGLLQPAEFLWAEGATKWVEAASVPGLFAAAGQKKYWLNLGGQARGPYVPDQVRAGLNTRLFDLDTLACAEGSREWLALRKHGEFEKYAPAMVNPSRAPVYSGSLDMEEAALHLAGKGGDPIARLLSTLMSLKRTCAHNPALVENLDRSIKALQDRRAAMTAGDQ